jgi:hypothetical protein
MYKLLLIAVLSLFVSCKSDNNKSKNTPKNHINIDFIKVFEGKIDNKYDYYAKLKSNAGKITGSYFYKNKCKEISIKGVLDSLGNIELKEYDTKGKMTGYFKGKMINEQKIEGEWSKDVNSKKFPFYFIKTSESFNDALVHCEKIRKSKILDNLVIEKIELLAFPATKESGNSWDNAFANYKPDIYILINNFDGKQLYRQLDFHRDVVNEDLPIKFEFEQKLLFTKEDYFNGFIINFLDHDSATNHDLLGSIAINKFKEHYESKKTTQLFEMNGVKIKLTFHYE